MPGPEFPDKETQDIIDAVFELKFATKHRLEDLTNAVQRLSVDYNKDLGSTLATADTLRTIYEDAEESLSAVNAIVQVEVVDKVRRILDADDTTP